MFQPSRGLLKCQFRLKRYGAVPRGIVGWAPGPTDWVLVAVMKFDEHDLEGLISSSQPHKASPARILKAEVPRWVPPEVMAAMTPLDETHFAVNGRKFLATPFAAKPGKSSATASVGTFIVVDDWFVILNREM